MLLGSRRLASWVLIWVWCPAGTNRDQSGERDPQKRISKQGNRLLRKLLVGSAHRIVGPFGEDSYGIRLITFHHPQQSREGLHPTRRGLSVGGPLFKRIPYQTSGDMG